MTTKITSFEQLETEAKKLGQVAVAVVGAADKDVLGGAVKVVASGIGRALLFGDREQLLQMCEEVDAPRSGIDIIHADNESEAVAQAVSMASAGEVGVLLKGMVTTGDFLRRALSRKAGLREEGSLISDVCLFPNPFRKEKPLWGLSDGGVNVAPNLEQKREILKNSLRVMRALGYCEPRTALLCASEKVDRSMPATVDAQSLALEASRGDFGPCVVEGPLAFDVAVSAELAVRKGLDSKVAGVPDLLLMPSIESGNILAKGLYLLQDLPVAHVIAGTRVPLLINSRNDSSADRYRSILLAMVVAAGWQAESDN